MADINKKLQLEQEKELNRLKKEQLEIERKMVEQSRINGPTQQKYIENEDRILKIEQKRLETEEKRKKAQDANFKKLTDYAKVNADLNREDKKSRDLAKNMAKLLDTEKGKILEKANIIKGETAIEAKALRDRTLADIRSGKLNEKEVGDKKRLLKVLNATEDLQKDILDDFEADTLETMTAEEAKQKVLEKAGITQQDFLKMSATEKAAINKQIEKMVKGVEILTEDGFKEMYDEISEIESTFGPIIEKTKKWGKILQNEKLRMTAIKGAALAVAASIAKDMFSAAVEVRQELGLGVGQAAALGAKITLGEKALKLMGGRAGEVQNFATGIAREFGNVEQVSTGVTLQFAKISAFTGITGENAAKLAKSIQIIQGGSLETSLSMIEVFEATARTAGVMPKLVLDDIASSTETFAKFAKDGGKNIAAAAAQAAKLGLNLDTVAGIAESLLDFESSIEKQMEASVLLGRQLNLDKARQLSLSGDLEGLQKEVVNQVGTQAEFEAMSVIQRKALADAIGTSVADLGKMVAGEKTSSQLAKERREAEAKHMDFEKAMLIAHIGLMTTQIGLQGILMRRRIATAISGIFSSFSFIPAGLGLIAAGGVVASMYGLIKSIPSLDKGGVVKESGMAEVHKGEVFSGTKNEMGFGTNMTETNTLIKKHIAESKMLREQNMFLMNKLIKTTGNIALEN